MTVSYPLTMPTSPAPRSTRFALRNVVGMAQSPFTLSTQVQAFQGQQWQVEVALPRMSRAQAATWQAFILKCRGKYGTFYMGDWDAETPRGVATGTPTANFAGSPPVNAAGDRIFYTTGWTGITVNILLEGDYIQIGSGASQTLHMVVNDASSDSNGDLTLDIELALRADIATGTTVITASTKGRFRLAANDIGWDSDYAIRYGFSFAAIEAQ